MDRLTVMKSFVAVGKAESFMAAARSLGVSGSLVSRHVAYVEQQLGVRLVNRTARSLTLTEPGRRYLEFCERILREIEEEEEALRGVRERAEGKLSILSPKWIGSLDLSDAVTAFAAAQPRIDVHFDIGMDSDRTFDFIELGYDLAFHTKEIRDSSVKMRRVATLPFVLCASEDYLRKHGAPVSVSDLVDHHCIVHRNDRTWHLEEDGRAVHYRINNAAFTSNTYLILQKAAIEGLGIALLPLRPIYDHLRAGRLQRVLLGYDVPTRPVYVVYAPGLQSVQKLRVFLDFISAWFKQFPIDHMTWLDDEPRSDGAHPMLARRWPPP
jgi:DNA-binding transcriptional LysR family regulator